MAAPQVALAIDTLSVAGLSVWLEKKAAFRLAGPASSEETLCREHGQHYIKAMSTERTFHCSAANVQRDTSLSIT